MRLCISVNGATGEMEHIYRPGECGEGFPTYFLCTGMQCGEELVPGRQGMASKLREWHVQSPSSSEGQGMLRVTL